MVLSVNMCGMAVTIWSTCGFERKVCVVWLLQFRSTCGFERKYVWYGCYNLSGFERKYVWYGCYNLVNLWFWYGCNLVNLWF